MLDARVHLNLPVTDPLFGQQLDKTAPGSASVLIVAGSQLQVTRDSVAGLVAGASGVDQSKISVLINNATSQVPIVPQDKAAALAVGASAVQSTLSIPDHSWRLGALANLGNIGYGLLIVGCSFLFISLPWLWKFSGLSSNTKRLS